MSSSPQSVQIEHVKLVRKKLVLCQAVEILGLFVIVAKPH